MDKPNSYWENPYQEDELEGDYYIDTSLDKYESYEHYLDDQMNPEDMFYLEDIELARDLISVGYHGKGEIYTRETFEEKKKAIAEHIKNRKSQKPKTLSFTGIDVSKLVAKVTALEEEVAACTKELQDAVLAMEEYENELQATNEINRRSKKRIASLEEDLLQQTIELQAVTGTLDSSQKALEATVGVHRAELEAALAAASERGAAGPPVQDGDDFLS